VKQMPTSCDAMDAWAGGHELATEEWNSRGEVGDCRQIIKICIEDPGGT
jgi:hypothetical protein